MNFSQNRFERKVAILEATEQDLKKAGFLWQNSTMKPEQSYISMALDKAKEALNCNYRVAQIATKISQELADKILGQCDFKAGLRALQDAEKYAQASKQQMRTQQYALPSYEKKR